MVAADPGPIGFVAVWVPLRRCRIGPECGIEADVQDGIAYGWDDSVIDDPQTLRPLFPFARIMVSADDAKRIRQADPPAECRLLWEAVAGCRRNAYWVPDGYHPPPEAHVGDMTDRHGITWPGWTWPSVAVPGGAVYYRPRPFLAMPTADEDGDREATIDRYLTKDKRALLVGGWNECADSAFARARDAGAGKKLLATVLVTLAARGLKMSVAADLEKRYGL
jgi:hypothetical protein